MSEPNPAPHYLVFIETSGNQAYVYATNKLRENVGASELTYNAGTAWALEAAGFSGVPAHNPPEFRDWVRKNAKGTGTAEVIVATSGKAILVMNDRSKAEQTIRTLTQRALEEAPGLCVTGAIVPLHSRDQGDVAKAMTEAHERFRNNRDLMPSPAQRAPMLPFTEACETSGLPAAGAIKKQGLASDATRFKVKRAPDWFKRINRVFRRDDTDYEPAKSIDTLERKFENLSWLGAIFADGNGLGQIMMKFAYWLEDGEDYLDTLRAFSLELDDANEAAFKRACEVVRRKLPATDKDGSRTVIPVVPLLLGGDDLMVLVDGRFALLFTQCFLEAFETESEAAPTLSRIARKALGAPRLSVAAGVAITKPHFPFYSAHNLAESLLKSAKLAKKQVTRPAPATTPPTVPPPAPIPYPCSSLDFHVLFDAAYTDLAAIRAKQLVARSLDPNPPRLWAGPYVVTPLAQLSGATTGQDWANTQHFDHLTRRIAALNALDDDDRRKLPSSQMHALREALAQGKTVADARLAELRWLDGRGLTELLPAKEKESLFCEVADSSKPPEPAAPPEATEATAATETPEPTKKTAMVTTTFFLDALTASDFWEQ